MNIFPKYKSVIATEQNIDNIRKALSEAKISLSNYKYIKSFDDDGTEKIVFSLRVKAGGAIISLSWL